MTIKDLIAELSRYPEDTEVFMTEEDYPVTGVFQYEFTERTLRLD